MTTNMLTKAGFTVTEVSWEGEECTVTVECRECLGAGYVPTVSGSSVCRECFGLGDDTRALEDFADDLA